MICIVEACGPGTLLVVLRCLAEIASYGVAVVEDVAGHDVVLVCPASLT